MSMAGPADRSAVRPTGRRDSRSAARFGPGPGGGPEEGGGDAVTQLDFLRDREIAVRIDHFLARIDGLSSEVDELAEVDRHRGHRGQHERSEQELPHWAAPSWMSAGESFASRAKRSAEALSVRYV